MARIVITGASGNLGQRAAKHLAGEGHEIVGLCLNPQQIAGIHTADLRQAEPGWMAKFAGAQAVVHLGAHPSPLIDWSAAHENIAMTCNALEAARRHGVRRFVFASSNWVMAGHRFRAGPIAPAQPPHPINPYGVSKYVGEELGRSLAASGALEFVGLRIGYLPADGRNGRGLSYGAWGQEMWLAPDDFCRAISAAALGPLEAPFLVCNLVSRNRGTRWSMDEAAAQLRFVAQVESTPVTAPTERITVSAARLTFALGSWLRGLWAQRRW